MFKIGDKIRIIRCVDIYRDGYPSLMALQDRDGYLRIESAFKYGEGDEQAYSIRGYHAGPDDIVKVNRWLQFDLDAELMPKILKPRPFRFKK